MIVGAHRGEVVASPGQEVASFAISAGDTAHIMGVLRDAIYSDKVLAVLREYGANAQDAHRDPRVADLVGADGRARRDTPIRVKLPTVSDPTLEIRDFGPGLSHEEMMRQFTQYGASTKRGSADTVGYLGIGCKSAYAYSDQFCVVSRQGGWARTYAAVLDQSDRGEMRLLDQTECDPSDTGLSVQVPVRSADVAEFQQKAREVFRFYEPRPEVGPEVAMWVRRLIDGSDASLSGGRPAGAPAPWWLDPRVDVVHGSDGGWTAVMGYVGYPVDVGQLDVPEYVQKCGGVVRFPLGALGVSASREALRYDGRTRAALAEGLCRVVDQHVAGLVAGTGALSDWEKRLRFCGMELFAPLLRGVTFDGVFLGAVEVGRLPRIASAAQPASASADGAADAADGRSALRVSVKKIAVEPRTRLVFVDDARAVAGFRLGALDVVIRRGVAATHAEAWDALGELIASLRLTGVPVVRTSALEWVRPATGRGSSGPRSPKHRADVFVRRADYQEHTGDPASAAWEPADREPEDGDLYVLLERFRPTDRHFDFHFRCAREVLAAFGGPEHPPVYGRKLRAPRPGEAAPAYRGRRYEEWLPEVYDLVAAAAPEVDELLAARAYLDFSCSPQRVEELVAALGERHPVSALALRVREAQRLWVATPRNRQGAVRALEILMGRSAQPDISALDQYPLLARHKLSSLLTSQQVGDWCDYVRAMDLMRERDEIALRAA